MNKDIKKQVDNLMKLGKIQTIDIKLSTAEKKLEELLNSSIGDCIPAGQKVGLYYSGGIDSALIATFFDFKYRLTYNDKDYKEDFKKQLPEIMKVVGKPINSFSLYGWWQLGKMAKKMGIGTVISGEGADELFFGYIRYMPTALYQQAREMFPSYKAMFPIKKNDDVHYLAWYDYNNNLPPLIEAEIKIANYFGLDIKFPFLSTEILNFAWSLPFNQKINGFKTKYILRQMLKKRNPDYKDIEKKGLFCGVNGWIGSKDGFNKEDYLKLQNELLHKQKIERNNNRI